MNDSDRDLLSPFERELLHHARATATWTLMTFLSIVGTLVALVILSQLGF